MRLPAKLKFFNVFNDGTSFLGECVEMTVPKLAMKAEEYRSGGMPGPVDIDLGVEKLEMEHTYGGPIKEIFQQFGTAEIGGVLLRFMGSYQRDDDGTADAYEITVRGRHTEIDPGSAKAGDNTEFKVKSSLTYYKLTINGSDMVEIDLLGLVYRVNGTDRLEAHRRNIGV